jgi:hypothetical protein
MFSIWIVLYHSFVYSSMTSPEARSYPKRIHFWRNAQVPTWTWGNAQVHAKWWYFLTTFLTTMSMAITKSKRTRKDYQKGLKFLSCSNLCDPQIHVRDKTIIRYGEKMCNINCHARLLQRTPWDSIQIFFFTSLNHIEHIPKMKTNYMGFDRACWTK